MIQETNNDGPEIEADALIELVDAPTTRGSHTPPPPPVSPKSTPAVPAAAAPTSAAPPFAATPDGLRPPSSPPSHAPSRLSSLPLAPPRPGTPSVNPISGDRPSSPPRASTLPRAPSISSPLPAAPVVAERTPLTDLQEQLDMMRRALSVKEAEMRTLLAQRDKGILELEAARRQLAARELDVKEFEFAALARETRIRELEKELAASKAAPGDGGDDLKLIKGIGPAFERELKRLGVRTFAQIAAWTQDEMETIAKKIKAKPERIRRDDWMARAAELTAPREKP